MPSDIAGRATRRMWLLSLVCLLLSGTPASGQRFTKPKPPPMGRWYVVNRDEGVLVQAFQRPNQSIPLLRGTGTIAADLYTVAAVLRDVDRFEDWMPHVVRSRLIERKGEFDFTFYQELFTPWPMENRYAILQVSAVFEASAGNVTARYEDVREARPAPRPGLVRMDKLFGEYRLAALSPTRTQVVLVVDADPGGNIPEWLVPVVTREMPRSMIVALRERVAETGGSYASLVAQWRARYGAPVAGAGPGR